MTQRFRAGAKVFQNFIVSHIPVGFSPPGVPLYAGLFLGLHRRVSLRARGLNRFHFFSPQFIKNANLFFHRLTIDAAASLADLVRRIGQPSGIQHL